MKNAVRLVFLLPALVLVPAALGQQELLGVWVNTLNGVSMTLRPDGTYLLVGPDGSTSSGAYQFQGMSLAMQDPSTGQILSYSIQGYDGQNLALMDMYGMSIMMTRAPGGYLAEQEPSYGANGGSGQQYGYPQSVQPQPATPAPVPAEPQVVVKPIEGRPIAKSGDLRLLSGHPEMYINCAQFIVGEELTMEEKLRIHKQCKVEFAKDPASLLAEADELHAVMTQAHALQDPVEIGLIRLVLLSALHQEFMNTAADERPEIVQIIYQRSPVLAYDAGTQLVLTRRDVDGLIDYMAFLNGMEPGQIRISESEREALRQQAAAQFAFLPVEQKQALCVGGILNDVVKASWNRLSPAQRGEFRAQLAGQMNTGPTAQPRQAPPQESSSQADLLEMQAEFQAEQMYFNMMSEMNLQSHITSMNIIENIGGTGNYWEVVEYP